MSGYTLVVPEITDFEVRRELIRGALLRSVRRLDRLKQLLLYLPINTHAMLIAAELWAEVRNSGRPTADIQALDADTILAGQAATCQQRGVEVVVATENVRHLETMTNAIFWLDIR